MYSFKSRVRYSETGEDGHLSLSSAVHYMQDCSTFQSEELGVGVEPMRQIGRAWFLSAWQIEFRRMPKLKEQITIGTWASGFKAMYGYRNFVIRDGEGEDLVRAASTWVYMNVETGRPERVNTEVVAVYGEEAPLEMEEVGRKIRIPESLEEYPAFPVRKAQIDTNGHVNNAKYIEMAEEWLPAASGVRKLRVAYQHAARHGDQIVPAVYRGMDSHTVVLKGTEGQIYAVLEARV
ncbi:MAG: acyl-[acyl-carrier-protein] thioesterase [Lachnospiraceae bacterium]|nr:acyl-[acyl-carrier-protein] thioesterase [Lachnospiraceae bacterium]